MLGLSIAVCQSLHQLLGLFPGHALLLALSGLGGGFRSGLFITLRPRLGFGLFPILRSRLVLLVGLAPLPVLFLRVLLIAILGVGLSVPR